VTTINHHLDDATILAFAAGTLPEAHGFVAATHAAYCAQCREALHAAESLGGSLMMEEAGSAVTDGCRAATLASLDAVAAATRPAAPQNQTGVPAVLCNLLGNTPLSDLHWRKKAPGVATFEVPLSKGGNTHLQLLRIGSGRAMPEHGHGGEELTLILRGSYKDHTGRYMVGDVADLDEDTEHQPVVDSDEDCICLVATEAPTKFKSIWARLAQPFIGI
jgi:putative transcriptional regulator